jgi:uncharacterized protein (TIGR03546 family)
MIVLKLLFKFVRLLNSETSATALALAFALGAFLGFVPFLTLQAWIVLLVVLFFRVNLTAALFTWGACKLASIPMKGALDGLGMSLLEGGAFKGLWTFLYNSPLYLCGTHHSTTLGGTVVGLALLLPAFFASKAVVNLYRGRFNEWWSQFGLANALRATKLYRLYAWIDSPFQG